METCIFLFAYYLSKTQNIGILSDLNEIDRLIHPNDNLAVSLLLELSGVQPMNV